MNMDHDMEKLETCIEKVFESGCATDGVMGGLRVFSRSSEILLSISFLISIRIGRNSWLN